MSSADSAERHKLVFEQYKLALEMAAAISDRRQAANAFFLSLVSAMGVIASFLKDLGRTGDDIVLLVLPIGLCAIWWRTLHAYRRINIAKWKVIYAMERELVWAPFSREHDELSGKTYVLSKTELAVPVAMGLLFLLLAVISVIR